MALARVTGTVLGVDTNRGISKKTGEPYAMRSARVLVAGEDVTTVGLPDKLADPDRLDSVDWLVGIRFSGQFLNIDYRADWSVDHEVASA